MQILLRLEIEAVCSDPSDSDKTASKNSETLEEVLIIFNYFISTECFFLSNVFAPKWQCAYLLINCNLYGSESYLKYVVIL